MNQLPPPAPLSFSGNIAENYKRFAQAFDIYMIATGISETSEKMSTSVLLGRKACVSFGGMTWG